MIFCSGLRYSLKIEKSVSANVSDFLVITYFPENRLIIESRATYSIARPIIVFELVFRNVSHITAGAPRYSRLAMDTSEDQFLSHLIFDFPDLEKDVLLSRHIVGSFPMSGRDPQVLVLSCRALSHRDSTRGVHSLGSFGTEVLESIQGGPF